MATQNHTSRPSQAIKDALWQTRQGRENEQSARLDLFRAEYFSATDSLYSRDAFTREELAPDVIAYAYTGQASGAEAIVLCTYNACGVGEYTVAQNDTRFTEGKLVDAVIAARLARQQRTEVQA